jgi:hypothetical protein
VARHRPHGGEEGCAEREERAGHDDEQHVLHHVDPEQVVGHGVER